MVYLLKLIIITSSILTILLIALTSFVSYLALNSLPDYNLKINDKNLKYPVEIIRDVNAIPHIYGKDDEDIFFALGLVHAQERIWQMMLKRKTMKGSLSEIFGEKSLRSDILYRTLNIYESARSSVEAQSDRTLKILEAYSNGINAHIQNISQNSLGRGGPEFFLVPPKITPWKPVDSIALLKLYALQSTDKANKEVFRTRLLMSGITPERINDLLKEPPLIGSTENFSQIRKKSNLDGYSYKTQEFPSLSSNSKLGIPKNENFTVSQGASNVFAVSPSRSATGSTLMASDPHTRLTAPSKYMLVSLNLLSGTVTGGTLPGIPAIFIGKGEKLGWGLASSYLDDQDLYVEKINPNDPNQYITEDGPRNFKTREEIIRIKDKKSITITVKSTQNGPILSNDLYGVKEITPDNHLISIKWTGLHKADRTIETFFTLMQADTIEKAKKDLHLFVAPGQNILLADKKNIYMQSIGFLPNRGQEHSTQGKFPAVGWEKTNLWSNYLPFETHPKIENPKVGMLVNTNNRITDTAFPAHISYDWGDSQRIVRVTDLLTKREFHTVDSFIEIQTDTISISARILLPLLAKELWYENVSNKDSAFDKLKQDALKALLNWNGEMNKNNPEPLLYSSWIKTFQNILVSDSFTFNESDIDILKPLFLERVLRNINGAAAWCDIIQTETIETCDDMAKRSLNITLKKLKQEFGSNFSDWQWGNSHIAIHKSDFLGTIPFLSFFANIIHSTSGGDNTLMMTRSQKIKNNPFVATFGSAMRAIFDFSDENKSMFILSTGQSGHILSKHYDDQSILWQQQQYIPITTNKKLILLGSVGTVNLIPENFAELNK